MNRKRLLISALVIVEDDLQPGFFQAARLLWPANIRSSVGVLTIT